MIVIPSRKGHDLVRVLRRSGGVGGRGEGGGRGGRGRERDEEG